jgi:hypothetical protein
MEMYFHQHECLLDMLSIKSSKYTTNYVHFLLVQLKFSVSAFKFHKNTKKLRKLIRNKLTLKQEQCASYFCLFLVNSIRCVSLQLWQHECRLLWGRDITG